MKPGYRKQGIRLAQRQRIRYTFKQIAVASSAFFFLLVSGLFIYFNFSNQKQAYAAAAGDFRSINTGNWNNAAIWERYNGTAWVAAPGTPASGDGVISIQNGHTVTVTAMVMVDQVVVDAGGTLTVSSSTTVMNGAGTDVTVNGTLNISNTLTMSILANADVNGLATLKAGGTISFLASSYFNVNGRFRRAGGTMPITAPNWIINSGGIFEHAINGASLLPSGSWKPGSTCEVTGITNTVPTNINMVFHHFIWNCPGQLAGFNFNARFDFVNGDLTIVSTGAATLQFDYQGNNNTTNIGGNFNMQGGIAYGCANGSAIFNVGGNYVQTGGEFAYNQAWANSYGNTSTTLNIAGDLIMSGGIMDMTQSTANNANIGKGHINLIGNIYLSGTASLTQTSADSHGEIVFAGTAIQTYDLRNLVTNKIDFIINPGATVRTNLNLLTSDGIFIIMAGGHIMIASPDGITKTSMLGNVQVTGTRTYNIGADYTYEGASAQVTGDGLPATVRNITFNNSNNVTLTSSTSATSIITFTNGKVITDINELGTTNKSTTSIVSYTSSKYVVGNLRRSVNATGSYDFPVGVLDNYELANINLAAATGFTSILGFFTNADPIEPAYPLNNVYVNGVLKSFMLNYGYWTLTPNSVMSGGTYTVTLNEKGHTNSAADPIEYCVLKRNNISSYWQSVGTHNNNTQSEIGGVATAARSALTSFSHFGIGKTSNGPGPLPVKLISFNAIPQDGHVNVTWATAAEINNDYFTLERSADGREFSEIAKITGSGSTSIRHSYSYSDEQPLSGTSYYRLSQTDYNRKSETFKMVPVSLNVQNEKEISLRVSPNPFSDTFVAEFESSSKEEIQISLLDMKGVAVHSDKIMADEGRNLYRFTAAVDLKPGTYFIRLANNKTVLDAKKIICKKS
ncbi:MAG TPA: T9SS type A sorting domain-containing protein [Bacteroidia bacterium]|nr:T9SS type A sorting domain-containing protein [Bacteroidia bacterium]